MEKIQAYKANDGKVYEAEEEARAADRRAAYAQRVGDFVTRSPLAYEGARDLEAWLLSDDGRRCVTHLALGVDE